jgi:uncharacterized protein YggE
MLKTFLLASLLCLAALAVACTTEKTEKVEVQSPSQAQGISVSGTGDASGAPDLALLQLGVSAEGKTVKEARDTAASAMNDVLDALKGDGVAENDVQTRQFRIEPEYQYPDGKQELTGFRVTNIVEVKARDLDRVGEMIDDVAKAGGDVVQVQGLSFTIEKQDDLRAQAREEAMADASARAEDLADLAGVKLGKPLSITESTVTPPSPLLQAVPAARGAEETTPIEAGELEVSVTVNVLFAIE